jgi:hypothetical protein
VIRPEEAGLAAQWQLYRRDGFGDAALERPHFVAMFLKECFREAALRGRT